MNKHTVSITQAEKPPHRRYCECGREIAALAQEFGPNLNGHLVKCEACGGYGHHSGNHTVCMHCGRFQYEGTCH
jgi:hypothetical protein